MNTAVATKAKEVGLLFTTENRKLVRTGVKTQTRRLLKLPQWSTQNWDDFELGYGNNAEAEACQTICKHTGCMAIIQCPYGSPQVEPVIYYLKEPVQVKALWDFRESNTEYGEALIEYIDDGSTAKVHLALGDILKLYSRQDWRKPSSSMFMLRSFARTWLKGMRTWPERLGDMSATDAIAEGIECIEDGPGDVGDGRVWRDYLNGGHDLDPLQSYASLWNSINGKTRPWAADLWTWAVEWEVSGHALN